MVDITSKPTARTIRRVPAVVLVSLALTAVVLAVACQNGGGSFPPPGTGASSTGHGGHTTTATPAPPCTEGAERECYKDLGTQGMVHSCYYGVETCTNGEWGACGGGVIKHLPAPPPHALYADAGPCANNPCDPTCQAYDLDGGPDGAFTIPSPDASAPPGGYFTWQGGSMTTLATDPGGLVKKGLFNNCTSAYDCQFDFVCTNPSYASPVTCVHSKCATGAALSATCDPPATSVVTTGCVQEICAVDAKCCTAATTAGCTADPCKPQAAKPTGCTATGAQTAVNNAGCSSGAWTQACADAFRGTANQSCGWDAKCVGEVGSVCQVDCGGDTGAGECVQRPAGWKSPTCTGVDLTLGIPCDDYIPVCNHGQSDYSGPVRIVMWPANSGHIPGTSPSGSPAPTICDVTKTIKAGECTSVSKTECPFNGANKEMMVNPSGTYGSATPVIECTRDNNWTLYSSGTPCGPPTCAGATAATSQIPVTMFIALDRSGSMSTGGKINTARDALNTFFTSPGSTGMTIAFRFFPDNHTDTNPCWDNSGTCTGNYATTSCATPQYGPVTLPDTGLVNYVTTNAVSTKLGGSTEGTPTCLALRGAEKWATDYKALHPTEIVVVVFVTDGDPNETCNCDKNAASATKAFQFTSGTASSGYTTNAADLADDNATNNGIHTYAIGQDATSGGISNNGKALLNAVAAAGGTTSAIILGPTTTAAQFAATMESIRRKEASCDLLIGACRGAGASCALGTDCCSGTCTTGACVGGTAGFDPANTAVVYTPSSGNAQTWSTQGCDGSDRGWYFDNPAAPAKVTLCSATCTTVQADTNPIVTLALGCPQPPPYVTTVLTQTFTASCPMGYKPQWSFLSYDTTTPGDSSVELFGQFDDTQAGLCPMTSLADFNACQATNPPGLSLLAQPSATGGVTACTPANQATVCTSKTCASNGKCTDPQVCTAGSAFPGCPVDVYTKTGAVAGGATNYFQLVMKLNPTSDGKTPPTVNSLELTYSCPPAAIRPPLPTE